MVAVGHRLRVVGAVERDADDRREDVTVDVGPRAAVGAVAGLAVRDPGEQPPLDPARRCSTARMFGAEVRVERGNRDAADRDLAGREIARGLAPDVRARCGRPSGAPPRGRRAAARPSGLDRGALPPSSLPPRWRPLLGDRPQRRPGLAGELHAAAEVEQFVRREDREQLVARTLVGRGGNPVDQRLGALQRRLGLLLRHGELNVRSASLVAARATSAARTRARRGGLGGGELRRRVDPGTRQERSPSSRGSMPGMTEPASGGTTGPVPRPWADGAARRPRSGTPGRTTPPGRRRARGSRRNGACAPGVEP